MRGAGGIPEILQLNPKVAIELGAPEKGAIAQAIRKARHTEVGKAEFTVFREKLCWKNLEDEILQVFRSLQEDRAPGKALSGERGNA